MARLAKAREDAAFKKKMTERSTYSATDGVKKARKDFHKTQKNQVPAVLKPKKKDKQSPGKQKGP